MNYALRLARSAAFYPLSGCWVGCIAVLALVADDRLRLDTGVVCVTLLAVAMLMFSMRREVQVVHHLVNSQRDEFIARIEQLVAALHAGGVAVPEPQNPDERTGSDAR